MSEYSKLRFKSELCHINEAECVDGYLSGFKNDPEPGNDKSKSFWHGWRNGMVNGGHKDIDDAQQQLAREVFGTYKNLN